MTVEYLHVTNLFTGTQVQHFQYVAINDGVIESISSKPTVEKSAYQSFNGWLVPGFVDVQVNGGGGVLFNNEPSIDGLKAIVAAHRQFGTVAMLPTLITDEYEVMIQAANAVAQARNEISGVVGIHFEGPHLSIPKKGIHSEHSVRALGEKEFALYTRQDLGLVLVTVAPENVSPDQISQLVQAGVIVCLGHSNANAQIVKEALSAGAKGFTHLFNAMSPLTSREPGMVGQALVDLSSYAGLITDFHHVHPTSCQLAIQAKGADKIMLVTDAMAHVGVQDDVLACQQTAYQGIPIYRQQGKLTLKDGTLAGSNLDMASAVRNCLEQLEITLKDAFLMASSTPAAFLGIEQKFGHLHLQRSANMVLLDNQMMVQRVWLEGEVYMKKQD